MNFDDDALYKHPDSKELYDPHEQEPLELEAASKEAAKQQKREAKRLKRLEKSGEADDHETKDQQ